MQSYSFIVHDPDKQFIGKASVLPEQLSDLEGTLVLTLSNADLSPVGTISCEKLEQIENTEHLFIYLIYSGLCSDFTM